MALSRPSTAGLTRPNLPATTASSAAGPLHFEVEITSNGPRLQRYTFDGSSFSADGALSSPDAELNTGQATFATGQVTLTGGTQNTPTDGYLASFSINDYVDRDHPWTLTITSRVGTWPGSGEFYLACGVFWSTDGEDLDYGMATGVALKSGRKAILLRNDGTTLGAFDNTTVGTLGVALVSREVITVGGFSLTIQSDGTAAGRDAEHTNTETTATPDLVPYLIFAASGDCAPAGITIGGVVSNYRSPS